MLGLLLGILRQMSATAIFGGGQVAPGANFLYLPRGEGANVLHSRRERPDTGGREPRP